MSSYNGQYNGGYFSLLSIFFSIFSNALYINNDNKLSLPIYQLIISIKCKFSYHISPLIISSIIIIISIEFLM